MVPNISTLRPHLHWCFSHIFDPVRRAIAIRSSSGLSCVPRLGTGMAESQDPDSGCDEASNLALENWSAFSSKFLWTNSMWGVSHALCLKLDSPSGSTSPWLLLFHVSTSVDTLNSASSAQWGSPYVATWHLTKKIISHSIIDGFY